MIQLSYVKNINQETPINVKWVTQSNGGIEREGGGYKLQHENRVNTTWVVTILVVYTSVFLDTTK